LQLYITQIMQKLEKLTWHEIKNKTPEQIIRQIHHYIDNFETDINMNDKVISIINIYETFNNNNDILKTMDQLSYDQLIRSFYQNSFVIIMKLHNHKETIHYEKIQTVFQKTQNFFYENGHKRFVY
jgi:hypothetical protein